MTSETLMALLASAVIGYLLGSIPSGYLAVKAFTGQDVRTIGSGRTGGTNVYRAAGRTAFIVTIAGDIAKGAASVWLTRGLFAAELPSLVAGFFALVGNNWSLYLRGRGGAGVMTSVGTLLAIAPAPVLLFGWFPILLARLTRIASIGSLAAATLGPLWFVFLVWQGYEPPSHLIYVLALGLMLVVVHAPNIQRLREGRERRIGEPVKKD
ncbi:MAG: glycerol-3-phosphate acyltransferase [Chloroflexi bacterium]|nr:glycerol-3-phosphate acyltransferase [Chloroflexota bacterium]